IKHIFHDMHKINFDISMNRIHKTAFAFYNLCWSLALPWLRLNHRLAEGYHQRALRDKLPGVVDLWIQAASVGESFLALEILETLQMEQPIRILLTSNTRQGIDILNLALPELNRDQNQIQAAVRYFPFDKPSIMAAAIAAMRPKLMVLLETEIWPGLLLALKTQNCKILIVNGRITEKSLQRYHFWPSIWPTLRPDKVLAISPADADRFGRLFGPGGIEVMSNIKFDRIAAAISCNGDKHKLKAILPAENPFIVLASVRQAEEILVQNIIQDVLRTCPETVVGLFPRHMHRMPSWQKFLRQTGIGYTLRSKVDRRISAGHVILWDTFGELTSAYGLAKSAFVGGSLAPLGGQNFLEALVSGVIPIIGPWWDNFAWVGREIIDAGLLRVAEDWKQVADLLLKDLASPPPRKEVMDAALQFIQARRGGTQMACRRIAACLGKRT
ncbi:MAG: glycosyltransferase N-terminal domain-containing protein, partial [Desulfobacterales bacterium]